MPYGLDNLRPYQQDIGLAILGSIYNNLGLTITVEIARQGGKNELSAHLEALLLGWHCEQARNIIKCSPTFKPQTVISMSRLKEKLNGSGYAGMWESQMGYIIKLGEARVVFLSAEETSSVVGNTAHLLLEVDEAQDVSEDKYVKEFKPMGSTTNVTNVLYGTTWDDSTLLEKMKQNNLELEKKDGIWRHFRYDCYEVAKYNPLYLAYVEKEKARLGENHPLFMTQYLLLPLRGGGGFLTGLQRAQLQGVHPRRPGAEPDKIYVAGLDLAGESESGEDDYLRSLKPRQDSTVMTIAELTFAPSSPGSNLVVPPPSPQTYNLELKTYNSPVPPPTHNSPFLHIVEHYSWTGVRHPEIYSQLIDLIKNVWHCKCVVVDATGIGQPVASYLNDALGSRVVPFTFTAQSKSELAFNLLAAINSGGLKMYTADNSTEYREFWHQMERAKSYYRASQTMNFFVDESDGHDDYLMSLALLVESTKHYSSRKAHGNN